MPPRGPDHHGGSWQGPESGQYLPWWWIFFYLLLIIYGLMMMCSATLLFMAINARTVLYRHP